MRRLSATDLSLSVGLARLGAALIAAALTLTGCSDKHATTTLPQRPERVVSLDYCADQFVLKLLDREQILAVSPDATKGFSYMREDARGVATVRPTAENVLARHPDLIVRSYGGGANAVAFYERAGVPVVQLAYPNDLAAVRASILSVAQALGVAARGEALVAQMDARLAALPRHNDGAQTLYLTPTGYTTGGGTLVAQLLAAAGLENFNRGEGWRPVDLERLASETPQLIAAATFGARGNRIDVWSAARHPLVTQQFAHVPSIALDGAWTSCGGWFLIDAVEALAAPATQPAAL